MISHLFQVRGNNGMCNLRLEDTNVLSVSSNVEIAGNVVMSNAILGNTVVNSLVVDDGFYSTPSAAYAYFTQGTVGPWTGSHAPTPLLTSVSARHAIQASQFIALSDARIKTNVAPLAEENDPLEQAIRTLPVKTWSYKDTVRYGTSRRLGFVAQDIPEPLARYALSRHGDFVPDVFRHATKESGKTYRLDAHGLKKGDRIKFCTVTSASSATVIDAVDEDHVTIDAEGGAPTIFVYGKYVPDILSIDYDALVASLISSHQRLIADHESLQRDHRRLEESYVKLDGMHKRLADRVAALEAK